MNSDPVYFKKKCGVWGQQTWLSYVTWAGKSSLHKAKLAWRRGRVGEGGSQQVYNDQMYQMYKYQMHYQWGRKWNRLQLLVTHSRSPVHFCFHSSTWNKASVVFICNRVKLKFKFPWTARRKQQSDRYCIHGWETREHWFNYNKIITFLNVMILGQTLQNCTICCVLGNSKSGSCR